MATVDLKTTSLSRCDVRRHIEDGGYSLKTDWLVNLIDDCETLLGERAALIHRVEQAKEILEDFVVNDGGHYMTAARLIRRGKAVLWLKALKEEPDSVG